MNRNTLAWILLALIAYAGFVGIRVWTHGRDPTYCLMASRSLCDPRLMPVPIHLQGSDQPCYDGLFFYRLGLNPWSTDKEVFGIQFDHPAYRHQRLGYPLVCWTVSLGQPRALAIVMILVNLFWLGVLAAICTTWARELGLSPAWGLLPLLWPGLLVSLGRDLCEIQAVALILTGIWLMLGHREFWGALALAGAALTREAAMLPIAGFGIGCAWQAYRNRRAADGYRLGWFVVPAAALLAWHSYLCLQYGAWPTRALVTTQPAWSPVPFKGLLAFLWEGLPFEGAPLSRGLAGLSLHTTQVLYYAYRCVQLGLCLLVTVLAAFAFRSSQFPLSARIAWLSAGVALYGLADWVWAMGPSSFMRIGSDCCILGLLVILGRGSRWRWTALGAGAATWGAGFVCYLIW